MKSIAKGLLVLLLLPATMHSQVFKAPEFSYQTDLALLAKEIEKHSPLMKQFYTAAISIPADIKPEEARKIVHEKLKELNNDDLNKTYAKLDEESMTRIGVALYLMLNGLSNTDDAPGFEYKSAFGGGLGIYLMHTLASFILMPELALWIRPLAQEYGSDKFKERYTYLAFAFTAMYMIRLQAITLLLGLSPNIGYALGGKYKDGDDDWESIDFDDDGVKRSNFGLGIVAGLLLQKSIMIRLMYNLGLSKLYEGADYKMYAIMLAVSIPIWRLN